MVYTYRNNYLLIRKFYQMLVGISSVPAVLAKRVLRYFAGSRAVLIENNNFSEINNDSEIDHESTGVSDDSMTHAHLYPVVDDRQLIHDRFARLTENLSPEQMQRLLLQMEVLMTHNCSRKSSEAHESGATRKIDVSEVKNEIA